MIALYIIAQSERRSLRIRLVYQRVIYETISCLLLTRSSRPFKFKKKKAPAAISMLLHCPMQRAAEKPVAGDA